MGSEADTETTAANAVDSDGSVSWEDFFGKLIRYNVFLLYVSKKARVSLYAYLIYVNTNIIRFIFAKTMPYIFLC